MNPKLKNKIVKIALIALALIRSLLMASPAAAQAVQMPPGQQIPVRFLHNISTKDIEVGNAIPLEIVHDIFINGKKLFAQGEATLSRGKVMFASLAYDPGSY